MGSPLVACGEHTVSAWVTVRLHSGLGYFLRPLVMQGINIKFFKAKKSQSKAEISIKAINCNSKTEEFHY